MFITNGIPAVLIKNNRNESEYYDDQDKTEQDIVVCPYNVDQEVRFGVYTIPEAKGYYIIKRDVDVREGDQLIFNNRTYSILDVRDNWIFNKIVNYIVAVK